VADGLDVVAVRIEHEGAVIVRVIMRPQAGSAMVRAAGGERGFVEFVDRGAVGRREGDMQAAIEPASPPIQKSGLPLRPKPTAGWPVSVSMISA
jgi:hypothetical protein